MKKRIRQCDPQKQSYWEAVVRRWKEGGQSVRDYCREEGLQEPTFYFWRRELARRSQQADVGHRPQPRTRRGTLAARPPRSSRRASAASVPLRHPAPFVPVRVVEPTGGCRGAETTDNVEIVLAQGRTLRVRSGFDRQTLVEVLAVLEGRPC